jgi:hypothetical protein
MDDGDRETQASPQQRFWPWLLIAALALMIMIVPLVLAL